MPEAGRAAWKIARDSIAGLDPYEKDLAREIVDSLIVENVCGATAALPIEELKSLLPIVARSASGNAHAAPAVRDLLRRLEVSTGGVIRLETDAARFDPAAAGAPELAAFNAALTLARGFDPRLTIARDRGSLDARLNRLDSSMALAVEGAVRTREVLGVGAQRGESRNAGGGQRGDRAIYRAGGIRRGGDARSGRRSILPRIGNQNRQRIRSHCRHRRIHPADANDARVPGGDRFARRAGRTRHQGKFLAAIGDHFDGDRVRTAASRAWPARPDGSAAQSRCARGALSKIQMDLCAMLPERACAMAREDGAAGAGGG